jgi:hypothetical protein
MTDESRKEPFAEVLARLAEQDQSDQPAARTEIGERVDLLLAALREAVLGSWPTIEELRQLPPDEFAALARQLSLFIDRLTELRVGLLSGRGPKI